MAKERKRLLNEDLVSEVPVNTSYGHSENRTRGRSRRQNTDEENRFEEVQNESQNRDIGLVNDVVTEDFQQSENLPSPGAQQQSQNNDMNVSLEDGSLSSMASSQHSYNSLPKGNQITIDQRPDLLK